MEARTSLGRYRVPIEHGYYVLGQSNLDGLPTYPTAPGWHHKILITVPDVALFVEVELFLETVESAAPSWRIELEDDAVFSGWDGTESTPPAPVLGPGRWLMAAETPQRSSDEVITQQLHVIAIDDSAREWTRRRSELPPDHFSDVSTNTRALNEFSVDFTASAAVYCLTWLDNPPPVVGLDQSTLEEDALWIRQDARGEWWIEASTSLLRVGSKWALGAALHVPSGKYLRLYQDGRLVTPAEVPDPLTVGPATVSVYIAAEGVFDTFMGADGPHTRDRFDQP